MIEEKTNINIDFEIIKDERDVSFLYFYKQFNVAPRYIYRIYDIPSTVVKEVFKLINNNYNLELLREDEIFVEKEENKDNNILNFKNFEDTVYIKADMQKKIIIKSSIGEITIISVNMIDSSIKNKLEDIMNEGFLNKNKNSVHILSYTSDSEMYLTDFKIDDKFRDLDIELNYNDDFKEVHEDIIQKIDSNAVGLYLLHGKPGTGKTTFIRYLIRAISKRVIFVSPSMSEKLSNPEMIPFLMKYPDSVLVIEDAESVIASRKGGDNQNVSNLLNLSDGILGDCLRFQIICTFNTDKESIDSALLRKGRLLKSYEFKNLALDKTNNLLNKLGVESVDEEMCLSDIYNHESNNFGEKIHIGFR